MLFLKRIMSVWGLVVVEHQFMTDSKIPKITVMLLMVYNYRQILVHSRAKRQVETLCFYQENV